MMTDFNRDHTTPFWLLILTASLACGLAEIIWVSLYASFTPLTAATIANEVTASLLPAYAAGVTGVWLGVTIHLLLSITLGYAFGYLLWKPYVRQHGMIATLVVSVLTLAAVWAMNFLVILPSLNPTFLTLLPYSVSFASKLMFAMAMAITLIWSELRLSAPHNYGAQKKTF